MKTFQLIMKIRSILDQNITCRNRCDREWKNDNRYSQCFDYYEIGDKYEGESTNGKSHPVLFVRSWTYILYN